MNCVIPAAPGLRGRAVFLPLALSFALLLPGCDYGKTETKSGSEVPVDPRAQSPVAHPDPAAQRPDKAKDDPSDLDDDDDANGDWVPFDGSEQVIVDDLSILTDGTPVRAAPAENLSKRPSD